MDAVATACVVFACVLAGAMLGMALRSVLPGHHLGDDSKDVVKMAAGLMATMSALVLGLMIASAKSSFDTKFGELKQVAADVILLDRVLAHYGPETKDVRDLLRRAAVSRLNDIWPEDRAQAADVDSPATTSETEEVDDMIRHLSPRDDSQRALQARALQVSGDAMQTRWMLFGGVGKSIQTPFLVVLVFWVTVIFATFGLFAPRNGTVAVVLLVSAMSIGCAIFLILELDQPFDGLLKMSSEPLRFAIAHLGK